MGAIKLMIVLLPLLGGVVSIELKAPAKDFLTRFDGGFSKKSDRAFGYGPDFFAPGVDVAYPQGYGGPSPYMESRFDVKFGPVEHNIEWGPAFSGKGSYGPGFKGGFDGGPGGFGFGGKGGFGVLTLEIIHYSSRQNM